MYVMQLPLICSVLLFILNIFVYRLRIVSFLNTFCHVTYFHVTYVSFQNC